MRLPLSFLTISTACILLGGCGTADYRAARDACEQRYLAEIPRDYQTVQTVQYRREQVKRKHCKTLPDGNRSCFNTYEVADVPYPVRERVDRNAERRDDAVAACVRSRCMESHGNPGCE